jgi:hypothetical protein
MTDSPLDDDLVTMAGDAKLAKAVRESLEKLRDGSAGSDLAEMARDLLDGRIDLRTVAGSSAYAGDLTQGIGKFKTWESELSAEERATFEKDARKAIYGD